MRSPDITCAHATLDSGERAVAPCTVYALKYLRLIHYQIYELDVIIQAAETQASDSGITSFSPSGFCVRKHDGTSACSLFWWIRLLLSAGSASAVLHVLGDMQLEEFEISSSWKFHGSGSTLLFNEAIKTPGYRGHGSGVN